MAEPKMIRGTETMTNTMKQLILLLSACTLALFALAPASASASQDCFGNGDKATGGFDISLGCFDGQIYRDPSDPEVATKAFTQAGGHPYDFTTTFLFNTHDQPAYGPSWPAEPLKDVVVDVPPGLIGNPGVLAQCTVGQLLAFESCPPASQVGTLTVRHTACLSPGLCLPFQFVLSLYNMVPPPGVAARFVAVAANTLVTLDARVRSNSDYGLAVSSINTSEGLPITAVETNFWGVPASSAHTPQRHCPGKEPDRLGCSAGIPPQAFLRLPTSCAGPQLNSIHTDSWFHPGALREDGSPNLSDPNWKNQTYISHDPQGLYLGPASVGSVPPSLPPQSWGAPTGNTDCQDVPFEPQIAVAPTSNQADSPSGLEVDLTLPQNNEPEAIGTADLKRAVVTLPAGMSVNPSSAGGQGSCSSSQIGLLGTNFPAPNPIRFNTNPNGCPENAKIGTVSIDTPLLDHPISGAVYLAAQTDNPFGSLLAMYLVVSDPISGTVLKLAGQIEARPDGTLVTTFDNQPQLPFEGLHMDLFGGTRAPLRTPSCGTHTASATLSPWSGGNPVNLASSFAITSGPSGSPCPLGLFDPRFNAGSQSPLAATYAPFNLRLRREDGTREFTALSAKLPPGLLGKLAGIPYCPEAALASVSGAEGTAAAQIQSPSCPAASQIGKVSTAAGAGATPFYLDTGKAYLAGPYKGAPLSMAIITPAKAGPFDLGSVLVRTALQVDPDTAQITAVSDPIPTSLHGIGLDLRDLRVAIDRPNFTLNPTSCDPSSIDAQVQGTGGASAVRSERFQLANCGKLAFRPKLRLALKGGTKRGAHPALSASLTMPQGNANIAKAQVTLPRSEFLDQAHIGTVCTRVQFAAHSCPARSVYGYAKARSPLLDGLLQGPVYLRSSSHQLPDLVADLNGQIEVALAGRIDTVNKGLRSSFEVVPDAPVTKFTLAMKGGKKGLLQNSTNLCAAPHHATVLFDAQNGKTSDSTPTLAVKCKKHGRKKGGH
jgi:hypothetical protein